MTTQKNKNQLFFYEEELDQSLRDSRTGNKSKNESK